MARFPQLPDGVIDKITKEVGQKLKGGLHQRALGGDEELGVYESFDVWVLNTDAFVGNQSNTLSGLVKPTGRWHHQLKFSVGDAREPAGFARSLPSGSSAESWSLVGLLESDLADRIDKEVAWLDRNVEGDYLVHLLMIPAYQIYAFWLVKDTDERVLVVDAPSQYHELQRRHLYSTAEFIDTLSSLRHVDGIL